MKTISLILIISFSLFISCKKEDDVVINTNCNGLITDTTGTNDPAWVAMPNTFTPNGDGWNDVLRPVASGVASMNFTVYDEYNAVVFTTNQLQQGFAPTTPPATFVKYYYSFQATTIQNHLLGGCGEAYGLACLPASLQGTTLYLEDMLLMTGLFQPPSHDPVLINICP